MAAPWFASREQWGANELRGFDREAVARGRYRQGRVKTGKAGLVRSITENYSLL